MSEKASPPKPLLALLLQSLAAAVLLCAGNQALGFPQNTRFGYANCGSCHVSPTGGGVLNSYGRMSSSELLSTWTYPRAESIGQGALPPATTEDLGPLRIGGDIRNLSLFGSERANFFMQRDLELAYTFTPKLTAVILGGYYAIDDEGNSRPQIRRSYLLLELNEHLSLRAGKFYPAYGLMVEDHTTAIRSGLGWDQGGETYNLELSYKAPWGELFMTPHLGPEGTVDLTAHSGYIIHTDTRGIALRAAAYLGKDSVLGLSYNFSETLAPKETVHNSVVGPYAIVGLSRNLYLLTEADLVLAPDLNIVYYNLLGYELIKGLHLQGIYQRRTIAYDEVGGRIQWFPLPHFEIVAEYLAAGSPLVPNTALLLLHYYL